MMKESELGREEKPYFWCDEALLEGMFFIRGAAPPPSRKFTDTPVLPPRLVEARAPEK
jgi:hypothetical protein